VSDGTPYRVTVYYEGPKSAWSGKVDPAEVIFDGEVDAQVDLPVDQLQALQLSSDGLELARKVAVHAAGNTGRCGYAITRAGALVEKVDAWNPAYPQT
jgi:hypothetical protein